MTYTLRASILTVLFFLLLSPLHAADDTPSVNPTATFTAADGQTSTESSFTGSAPIKVACCANPSGHSGWEAYYEWRIFRNSEQEPYIIRYEQDTDLEFSESGTHRISLIARFTKDGLQEQYYEMEVANVTVSESQLQMPNAFSPNGDGMNDIYKAKSGYQSLVEFHAYIFNRWGQKLYEWTDPAGGWDGTYGGKPVKDGVYFCLVKAKGADGKTYNIKKDVNLLRGYTQSTTNE